MAKLNKYQIFRYPNERIEDYNDYLQINVINYTPPGFGSRSGFRIRSSEDTNSGIKKPVCSIILPIPTNISDSTSVEWGSSSINSIAAAAGGGAADALKSGKNVIENLINSAVKGSQSLLGTAGNSTEALSAGFAANSINSLLGQESIDPFDAINRQTGSILNQNQELLFRGVTLRSHQFSWNFTPRFQEEASEVKNIIRIFKSSMSAKKTKVIADSGAGIFIQSPDVFELAYFSGKRKHPFLNVFKTCALGAISVNYSATGNYATYADGTPIQITMGLSFQELTPIYAEDYETSNGLNGVGY